MKVGTHEHVFPTPVFVGMAQLAMPASLRHGSTPPIDAAKKEEIARE
jgi:hypothetical protein